MTEHPITPPTELVEQWRNQAPPSGIERATRIATQAARWGADTELEACCQWLIDDFSPARVKHLRAARRPKPPSKKQRALKALSQIEDQFLSAELAAEIRCALEELPDD